jgi:hypothetical protein
LVWPHVRSLPKIPLLTPLKAQKLPLKVPMLLQKAPWKPLKALPKQPVKPRPPLATLLLLVQTLLLAPPVQLAMPLLPLAKLPKAQWKLPSKFSNLLECRGRHPQGWRPFPFRAHCGNAAAMKNIRLRRSAALSVPLIISLILLAGCGDAANAPSAGGMTVGENERLEAAAERLDARAPSPAQPNAAQLEAEVAAGIEREQQAQPAR